MLLARNLIDSVLPSDLKELVNDGNSDNLNTVVSNLQITLNKYKDEIKQLAEINFKQLQPEVENSERLMGQINSLHSEIDLLKSDLKENEKSLKNVSEIEEYKQLIDRIEMINVVVSTVDLLRKYDKCLEDFADAIDKKDYTKCDDLMTSLLAMTTSTRDQSSKTSLNSQVSNKKIKNKKMVDVVEANEINNNEFNSEILNEINMFKELNEEFTMQKERLWYELNLEWDKLIQIDIASIKHESSNETTTNNDTISIKTDITQDYLNQLTLLSHHKNTDQFVFITKLKQFSKKFLQFCEENLISKTQYNITIIDNSETNIKVLKLLDNQTETLNASDLLELKLNQIEQVLKFLNKYLFHLNVFTIDHKKEKLPLMVIFSDLILKDFVKLIYEKLIINIIPLTSFDYQLEIEIKEKVNAFEASLKEMEFLDKKQTLTTVFDSFKNNVEELYVRKKCKFIMEKSRELMKQKDSLFKLIKIDEIHSPSMTADLETTVMKSSYIMRALANYEQELGYSSNKSSLDEFNLLHMQTCSISQIAQTTVESVYATLNEAVKMVEKAQDSKNISLLCIVARNLFDIYANVIPTFHRESLEKLPLFSAIAYNDFMYLAFNCLTVTHQYKTMILNLKENQKCKNLKNSDVLEIIQNFSCLDMIPKLYSTAAELLHNQIEKQQVVLMQYLNEDCNGIRDLAEGTNYEQFKKALQKCIFQLNKLASIWFDVLPVHIYYRVFGQLFNMICNDLLRSCLRLEDISSDDASYLESAFSLIKIAAHEIFSKHEKQETVDELNSSNDSKQTDTSNLTINNKLADFNATKYIKLWQKFKYLLKVLKAHLQDIVDLWSDSKGPLALYFDSEEVRHLIRALFMITDKRSAALAKIK